MRWKTKSVAERAEWRRWFAVFPTVVAEFEDGSSMYVWLEFYERSEDDHGRWHRRPVGSTYDYRVPRMVD